jgi:formyl-CoA transferase
MQSSTPLPLDGITVIDLSNFMAAPGVGMYLADFGADVIKVERPGRGDELRAWGYAKDGVPLYWKMINRNKKCITADLHAPLGVEIVKRLVRDADVVIENYRPGTFEKWGLGYDVLRAINPRIVMVRITGYGQYGPNCQKPGFGTALEAYSGGAYVTGYPDRAPLLPSFPFGDNSTAIFGAFLTMVALRERDAHSGEGQVIDLALYEGMMTLLGPSLIDYDQLGIVQERMGSRIPWTAPRNVYRCKDGGFVSISGSGQSVFVRLCEAIGVPDVATDPRFVEHRDRIVNVEALDQALQSAIATFDRDELVRVVNAAGAVCAPVRSVAEIFEDPHVAERENIVAVEDPELGRVRMQNVLGHFSRTPGKVRWTGPRLGEHNEEILIEKLGFTREQLETQTLEVPV